MMKQRAVYLITAILLTFIEVIIAVFCKPGFIRSYFGDVLVTVLLCSVVRLVFTRAHLVSPLVFAFSVVVEWLQYIKLASLLGVEGTVLGVIIGTTFSLIDILCYLAGCVMFSLSEYFVYYILKKKHRC